MAGATIDRNILAVLLCAASLVCRVRAVVEKKPCLTTNICKPPGDMDPTNVPEMVLFTYAGPINATTRHQLDTIFPSTFRNPNGCPIGITTFVISQESDPCSVRLVHARGHEIALSGERRTSRVDNWNVDRWNRSIYDQQKMIANRSAVDEADIVGMRAQQLHPGNNSQFEMLNRNSFTYDSSLLVAQTGALEADIDHFWPFEMTADVLEKLDCEFDCPNDTFQGLWQIPAARLFRDKDDRVGCVYLDQCLSTDSTDSQVEQLLNFNYQLVQKAPLQINLRKRFLDSQAITSGIQKFITSHSSNGSTWFITMHDLIQWMNNPTENQYLNSGFWLCRNKDGVTCAEQMKNNNTLKRVTFASIINVDHILMWQTIFLIILYIVIYRYDKYMQDNKNK